VQATYSIRRRKRDEEQHVDPLQKGGFDGEKSQANVLDACARRNARHEASAALDALPPRLDAPLLFPAPEGGLLDLDNFRRRALLDGAHNVIANRLDAFEAEMEQATAADTEA
jgi:hypothetical protein